MKRNHKVVVAAAAGLAAALALSACSTSGSSSGGSASTTHLTFLTFETPDLTAKFWDNSISDAEKQVPGVTVKQLVSPNSDRNAYAKQLQASGQFPDVLASIDPTQFTPAGLLKPFSKSWLDANFTDPTGNNIDGKTYIPPTNTQIVPMIFYNKEIFKKDGITSVPTTWNEFLADVKTIKADGQTPLEMAGGDPSFVDYTLTAIITADVLAKNPNWVEDRAANKVKFTDADMAAAFQKYENLIQAGAFSSGALGVSYNDANSQFIAGDAAMYPMGSWLLGQITQKQSSEFGTFILPSDTGKTIIPFVTGGTTSVSTKGPDVTKAVNFAKAWSLSKSTMKTLIETDGAFPNLKKTPFSAFDATVTPLYKQAYAFVTDDNVKVDAFGQVSNQSSLPAAVNTQLASTAQKMFTDTDINSQLAALDAAWAQSAQQ